jgi:hypothetical protein
LVSDQTNRGRYIRRSQIQQTVNVEFECIVCGETAVASVDESEVPDSDEPMETLHDCPTCEIETIWVAT